MAETDRKQPPTKKARTDDKDDVPMKDADGSKGTKKEKKKKYEGTDLELKIINTIRALSADLPNAAKSGHPGAPMGCAPMAHLLWSEVMTYSPSKPDWWNRDRFVLSNGHACALQYVMLHLTGYGLTMDDLRKFRRVDGRTPGHPECFLTPGVEVCTGPLGQGISNAVGLSIAERHFASHYNTTDFPNLFDHRTYVICGDGCLQEGVSSETGSLAGHLGLGRLIVLYDDNGITIDGPTSLSFSEDVCARYEAYGWHVQTVTDVADGLGPLRSAIESARSVTDRPSLIKVRTTIGYGSVNEGSEKTHGSPLGEVDLSNVRKKFGLDPNKTFHVDDDVRDAYKKRMEEVEAKRRGWDEMYAKYGVAHPDKAKELDRRFAGELPDGVCDALPKFEVGKDKDLATRKFSELCLNSVAPSMPELMGGSADLTPSNLTSLKCSKDFTRTSYEGRYLRFGVREHGMCAVSNGMYAYGGLRPYCATFLVFAGYAMGAIRLSALSKFGIIYVMTHDSIGLGEDGPTHQPVETLESLRATPNVNVVRPADSDETSAAYRMALESARTPTVICCSRSTVKGLVRSSVDGAMRGAYVVHGPEDGVDDDGGDGKIDLIIVGTGSEVGPCVDAAVRLTDKFDLKVRVVSMPCQEAFLSQSVDYQRSVLPGNVPTLSVEASSVNGWHRFSHAQIGMNRFGMSGPGKDVFEKFGFTVDNIVAKGRELVDFYKVDGRSVPDLSCRPVFESFVGGDEGH